MIHRDRVLIYLAEHPEGADDDELAAALGFPQRQAANMLCRMLAEQGLISRVKQDGRKIRNFAVGTAPSLPVPPPNPRSLRNPVALPTCRGSSDPHSSWYWEGNVQSAVVRHLAGEGYDILRVCDTASREHGKDVEARRGNGRLWVTVKGYPEDTEKTRAAVQAGHWFSGALFDIICWRGEDESADLALALPDFPRYRNLADRVSWLKSAARFHLIWVSADGSIALDR